MNSASARASSVLPTPVGPRNRNEPIGRSGSCRPGARAAQRGGDRLDRLVLADDAFVQALLHVDQLLGLALEQAADGDAGPARDDLGDVVGVDLLLEEHAGRRRAVAAARASRCFVLGELAFELGDLAVAQLGGALQVGFALGALGLDARLLEALLELARRPGSPPSRSATAPSSPPSAPCSSASSRSIASRRSAEASSVSFAQRGQLDLELHHAPVDLVDLGRQRVDLDAEPARRPRRSGRSPCRAGSGRRCSGRRASRRRSARCPGCARRGGPRSAPSARAGSRSCPRRVGSPTITGWKRRSSAASFSMCLRYSSSVVAPTQRSSPRASIGLSRLAASTAPSAAPAPTIVCSSSRNRMIVPCGLGDLLEHAPSGGPRTRRGTSAPAISAPMSSAITRRSRSDSGTSPETIRWARPSTIAVLPTPGSPISTGLFLVRRESTWITRRISSSRPITGSSLPCSASSVRSRPKRSSASYFSSGFWSVTRLRAAHLAERLQRAARGRRRSERSSSPGVARRPRRARAAGARSRRTRRRACAPRRSAPRSTVVSSSEGWVPSPGTPSLNFGSSPSVGVELVGEGFDVHAELREHAAARRRPGASTARRSSRRRAAPRSRCAGITCGLRALLREPRGGRERFLGLDREAVRLHRCLRGRCCLRAAAASGTASARRRRARARAAAVGDELGAEGAAHLARAPRRARTCACSA